MIYVACTSLFIILTFLKQAEMHYCAAKCCEDQNTSLESVQRCVDRCSTPLNRAQRYVQHEIEEFQGRLQRCVMVILNFFSTVCLSINYFISL